MILCDTNIFIEAFKNNKDITKAAVELIEKYSKSHGFQIPDALIAATAICNDTMLLTYNLKDFRFINELSLFPEE